MMKGWVSPKTIKYTARHDAIAEEYSNGVGVKILVWKYGLSRTWIYQVLYCYGLSPRTRLTETGDPLNYHRLRRHLKRQGKEVPIKGVALYLRSKDHNKQENHRPVPEPQTSEL